jgi:TRAP-type C4-dicarboxylate transport system permease small subunit
MQKLYLFVFRISQVGSIIAAAALIYMVAHIAIEIVMRGVFASSTFTTYEFVGYAISICIVWSLGYALEHEQLIRVGIVLNRLPERMQQIMTSIAAFCVCAATIGLATVFWMRAARAYSRGTVSSSIAAVPTWIPESLMFAGLCMFALQLAAYGLRHLTGHASPSEAQAIAPRE